MNQMKYLISATLLLVTVITSTFLFSFLNKTSLSSDTAKEEPVCGNVDKLPTDTLFLRGKTLFQQNCQACHSLDKEFTGPALRGFRERGPWKDKEKIHEWLRHPPAFMQNDAYTKELQKKYQTIMPAFPTLPADDIDQIIGYLSQWKTAKP